MPLREPMARSLSWGSTWCLIAVDFLPHDLRQTAAWHASKAGFSLLGASDMMAFSGGD